MVSKIAANPALDFELLFMTKALKLTSLHFGCWEEGDELTLENLRAAQQRYTDTLLEMIPEGVQSILDVGCGLGDIAVALAHMGHQVTAISPDEYHRKYFASQRNGNVDFRKSEFESFRSSKTFDLVLMSESQNYFDPDIGLQQTINHLDKGGYLLVSGIFKISATDLFKRVICIEDEYLELAKHYGLDLIKSIDITPSVMPQTMFAGKIFHEQVEPFVDMLKHYAGNSLPFRLKIIKFLTRKELRSLEEFYEDRVQRVDPLLVEEHLRYMRFLFVYR